MKRYFIYIYPQKSHIYANLYPLNSVCYEYLYRFIRLCLSQFVIVDTVLSSTPVKQVSNNRKYRCQTELRKFKRMES